MSEPVRIAGAQIDVALADPARNLDLIAERTAEAANAGARLVVFPECAVTGYCFESLDEARALAQPLTGPNVERLVGVARTNNCHLVAGMIEADGPRIFNACVLVGPEGLVGGYRKIHLPMLGLDQFATAGDQPFRVRHAAGVRVGMNICYDGGFPESSRVMALDGAELIVLPTNWPPAAECMAGFAVNTRAMENHVYYMSVNRVGEERGFRFIGASRICDPTGKTLDTADHDREAIIYADIDPVFARNKHLIRVPGKHEIHRFRDRRPEMYGRITAPKD
jgi:5-aminopentanamidase